MSTYTWGLPTRIFHLSLVIFIIVAWISADNDYLQLHSAFGYAIGVLIVFRLLWGLIGPKYSHFRDFNFSIKKALDFSKNVLSHNNKKYIGHNPAAALVLFSLLIIVLIVVVTGVLTLGAQDAKGIFSGLNTTLFKDLELFEELHEISANIMLVFIAMHLAGLLTDWVLHKEEGTILSIVKGYKNLKGENAKINIFQTIIAVTFFILTLLAFYFTFTNLSYLY
ncbi:MAG: cytochrome b/b6 domain-containing protein [Campylobacteraceae bacterium]|nr:cytochrome b/b6 domain-containing protein [Campylobacteraceae bacterium]